MRECFLGKQCMGVLETDAEDKNNLPLPFPPPRVFYYSTSFFNDAGMNGQIGTVLTGLINVISTGISIPLIEKFGRRPLILLAESGMLVSIAVLTGALLGKSADAALASYLGPVAIIGVLFFVTFFEFGLGAIPWSIAAEIFPGESRGAAMAIAATFNWFANTLVAVLFPIIAKTLGNLSFLPFAAWLTFGLIFTIAYVPETRGKEPAQLIREINSSKRSSKTTADDEEELTSGLLDASA
jgi:MFS family permease